MTHTNTNTEQERVDTTVFKRLLNDYADCLRNGDFQDAGAALLAVVAEYQQAARRAPAAPVVLPEPDAYLYTSGNHRSVSLGQSDMAEGTEQQALYTERQVRALLATAGQAQVLGHDFSKAIGQLTDAIERNKQENQK